MGDRFRQAAATVSLQMQTLGFVAERIWEFCMQTRHKVTGLTVQSYHGVSMGERAVAEEMDDIGEVVEVPSDDEIQIQPK